MVNTGREHRFWKRHIVDQYVEQHLQHSTDDPRPTRTAGDQYDFTVTRDDGRAHAAERSFARGNSIGVGATEQAKGIRITELSAEVVHLVIQQYAGTGHHYTAAEIEIHSLSGRNCVSVLVEHRNMSRTGRFDLSSW